MPNLLVGCGPFPPRRKLYMDRCSCVELSESVFEPFRHQTLRKWNAERPDGFKYILAASRWLTLEPLDAPEEKPFDFPTADFGLFQPTDANKAVWDQVREQADELAADTVLIKSPTGFSPADKNLRNLETFRRDIIGEVPFEIVWEPRGIWLADELHGLGEQLNMTIAQDPHGEAAFPTPRPNAYYVLTAPRGHLRFNEDDLFDLIEFLEDHEGDVRVVFRGADR